MKVKIIQNLKVVIFYDYNDVMLSDQFKDKLEENFSYDVIYLPKAKEISLG